jgi:hypothetical protein
METRKQKRRIILLAVILLLSVGNYFRMFDNEPIRTVHFIQIFIIGAISSLLIYKIVAEFRK